MYYYIFDNDSRKIEKVKIEKEYNDTYILKNKAGIYSELPIDLSMGSSHQLKIIGNGLKSYEHLYLEKYFIIYYTSLWEFKNYILKDKSEEYDYKMLKTLNSNLGDTECLLDPTLKKCYGPIINYKELFKLTDINMPLYYAKYDYYVNGALELKYSNPSPFGIDDQLYQKQFSKTMEDDSLISNLGIEFNHQPIQSMFFN